MGNRIVCHTLLAFILLIIEGSLKTSSAEGWITMTGPGERSMWVWRTKSILEDPKERKIFFDFCKSPHCDSTKSIKLLFFSVKKGDFLDQKTLYNLRNFLDEAHSQGIGVFYCVGGDPDWAKRENHGKALERISLALEFNTQSQSPKERFEGILFDVEPFLLEDWKKDPKTVADQWVELVGKCKDLIESSGQKFIFGWVIPYWLDKEKYEFLNKKLQDLTDFVAVMDYWDTAKRIIEKGRGEIDYGEEINKKVIIGVNTKEAEGTDPSESTFLEEGNEYMERELYTVHGEFKNKPAYAGIAVHHYWSYIILRR